MVAIDQGPAELVLLTDALFTGTEDRLRSGFVAIGNGLILAVGDREEAGEWIGELTEIRELGNRLVMPGVHDNHVFFTGYMSMRLGLDLSDTRSAREALEQLIAYADELPEDEDVYAYGWNEGAWGERPSGEMLNKAFSKRCVIAINTGKSYCWMNRRAIERYGFRPDACSAEARAHLLKVMQRDPQVVERAFLGFCEELAKRGVTSIKDIGFDDYVGVLPMLEQLEEEGRLPLRVHFALEPVLEPADAQLGLRYLRRYAGDRLRFQGYKLMVDGVVADHTGDMLEPYADLPGVTCLRDVDYESIERTFMELDASGLKCCLTAEGDAAIRRCVSMLERAKKEHGERNLRHSISDLEYPHPDDLRRMGQLNVHAEVYAQVLLLNPSHADSYMAEVVGMDQESRFYDYRAMLDAGINVTIGTDLPLFMPSVPDSLYAASARRFPDGSPDGGWHIERGMTPSEVLRGWTVNGARHCGTEDRCGTLEAGKYADIAVFDRNLFETEALRGRDAKVVLTIVGGSFTYDAIEVS